MARKKHHKRKTHHRRRVGALHMGGLKEALMTAAGVTGGILLGRVVNNMVNPPASTTTKISPTILGLGEAVVGGMAAGLKQVRQPLLKGVVMGFAANGLLYSVGAHGLAVLPASLGYGPDPMHRPTRAQLQGFRDVPKIGFPKPGAIGVSRDKARMASMYAGIYG